MTKLGSIDSTLYPSPFDLVFRSLWLYFPDFLLRCVRYLPLREYRRQRTFFDYSQGFSRDLVRQSMEKHDGKDVMSVLLRANGSEDPKDKMSNDEVVCQISCARAFTFFKPILTHSFAHALPKRSNIMLAGHDTTASTLSWFLWEIAKHPESQERIRTEVAAFREQKGEELPTAADLDNMTYTQAALKVLPRRTIQELPFSSDDWLFFPFLGVDEAAPDRLGSSQSSRTRRCDSLGVPYHYEFGRANFVHSDQERHSHRHLHRRV
jgi:hypothetical protein